MEYLRVAHGICMHCVHTMRTFCVDSRCFADYALRMNGSFVDHAQALHMDCVCTLGGLHVDCARILHGLPAGYYVLNMHGL